MKLNENGDFCLLYVEPADEKQSLFTTISAQQKPVVLMLPPAGQPRAKLFQRPEDFSDLKHVRRQSGVSVVFLTAGSERLAQMAARYGFPSYPSIDDFADFLLHGYRASRDESLNPLPPRRVRTGPLIPGATAAQIAALRRSMTGPLNASDPSLSRKKESNSSGSMQAEPWTGHGSSVHPPSIEESGAPAHPLKSEPWTGHESSIQPLKSEPWTGHGSNAQPRDAQSQPMAMEYEYTAAFHDAQTIPLSDLPRMAWPLPGEDIASVLSASSSLTSLHDTPQGGGRVFGYQGGQTERGLSVPEESAWPVYSEFPRPRPSTGPVQEPHAGHPGWREDTPFFESGKQPAHPMLSSAPVPTPRNAQARPTRDLRNEQARPTQGMTVPARPTRDLRGRSASAARELSEQIAEYGSSTRPTRDLREQMAHTGHSESVPARASRDQQMLAAGMASVPPVRPVSLSGGAAPARPTRDLREQQMLAAGIASVEMPLPPTDVAELPTRPGPRRGSQPGPARPAPRRGSIWPLLVILTLLIITGGALGSFVAIAHVTPSAPTAPRPVGMVAFLSSEQLNVNTSQGLDDEIQVSLRGLGTPAPGNGYYAWLLGDAGQSEAHAIPLGKLSINNDSASLFYAGDGLHTNLLQIASRFLVTEEKSSTTPLLPSPDNRAWRYYGALPAVPDQNDAHRYSFLNHLRHLLADEPLLDEMELPGGLNNWFTRNTQELIQLTSGARDHWQNGHNLATLREEGVEILAYLDGMAFLVPDLPNASAHVQLAQDMHQAGIGLLDVHGSTQNPPGYIDQIAYHLNGLLNAPGSPGSVRSLINQILPTLNSITAWLQKLRSDDKALLAMTNTQLRQDRALSLLDDMVLQASNAYSGNTDPATGKTKTGVTWIQQQLQSIATFEIDTYVIGQTPVPEVAPSSQSGPAFLLPLLNLWKELG